MDKSELIRKIAEYDATPAHRLLRKLFEVELEDIRQKNDEAEITEVTKNQGAIRALKRLLKVTSPKLERSHIDGAYN